MRTYLTTVLLAGCVILIAAPAMAQDNPPPPPLPRLEVGGHITAMTGYGFMSGAEVVVNLSPRHAIQVNTDVVFDHGEFFWQVGMYYSVQYRFTLPLNLAKTRIFLTAGGLGDLEWTHNDAFTLPPYTYIDGTGRQITGQTYSYPASTTFGIWPPLYPTGGLVLQYNLGKRVVVRGDVSVFVYGDDDLWFGARASGGIAIGFGRLK